MIKRLMIFTLALTLFCCAAVNTPAAETAGAAEKEISILKCYGIYISSDENGCITNADFAETMLQALGIYAGEKGEAAINTLRGAGIVPADMRFLPQKVITVDEAYMMCVNALGYEVRARYAGYYAMAAELDLNKNIKGGGNLTKDVFAVLIYNMLMAPCNEIKSVGNDKTEYQKGGTLLETRHDGLCVKAVITACENASIEGYEQYMKKNSIYAGNTEIKINGSDIENYLGYKAEIYAVENEDNEYELGVYFLYAANEEKIVSVRDVLRAKGFSAADSQDDRTHPMVEFTAGDKKETAKMSGNVTVIYNGTYAENISNDDFAGDNGSLRFIDHDNDGYYDIVNVRKYESGRVAAINIKDMIITFEGGRRISLDGADKVTVKDKEHELPFSAIGDGTVIGVYAAKGNKNSGKAEIDIFSTQGAGTLTAINAEEKIAEIDGKAYYYTDNIGETLELGENYRVILDNNDIIVYALHIGSNAGYAYFVEYAADSGITDKIEVKVIDFNSKPVVYTLNETVKYTGLDENGIWLEKANIKTPRMKQIMAANFTGHQLIKIVAGENGITELITAENMSEKDDYKGYSNGKFTLDDLLEQTNGYFIRTNRCLNENYKALPLKTTVILDNLSDDEDVSVEAYTTGSTNILAECSFVLKNGYIYDSDDELTAAVFVAQYDPVEFNTMVTSSNELTYGNKMIIDSVMPTINQNGEETYIVTGYIDNQRVRYTAENAQVTQKFVTAWAARGVRTVGQLRRGDIISPVVGSGGMLESFFIYLALDENNTAKPHYTANSASTVSQHVNATNTAYGKVMRNYDNDILVLEHIPDIKFLVSGTVYICDTKQGKLMLADAGEYINDASSGMQDTVCIIREQQNTNYIVIYR